MYILVEKDYPIKDTVHFDGINVEDWIDRDLRKEARALGFTVNDSAEDEIGLGWTEKLQTMINARLNEDNEDEPIYRTELRTPRIMTSADGTETESLYSRQR